MKLISSSSFSCVKKRSKKNFENQLIDYVISSGWRLDCHLPMIRFRDVSTVNLLEYDERPNL